MVDMIKAMLFGASLAKKIIKANPTSVLIFTNDRVGDTCIQLAWAKQFKEKNNIKNLVCVTTKSMASLEIYFENIVDHFYYIDKKDLQILFKFYKSDLGLMFYRRHPELLCTFMTAHVRNTIVQNPSHLNFADVTKAIYHLPPDTRPVSINCGDSTKAETLVRNGVIVPKKTILLNPNAKTIVHTPFSFFVDIADQLRAKGYNVITSVHGDEPTIHGTVSVDFSLSEAIQIANACGVVIGARSGFLDLLSFSDATIISVDNNQYDYSDYFNIQSWGVGERIRNFMYRKDTEKQLVEEIVNVIISCIEQNI